MLPPVEAAKPVSLELYLRAYDDRGNEVLTWADAGAAARDPAALRSADAVVPQAVGVDHAAAARSSSAPAIIVYALTIAPPDHVSGSAVVT